MIEETSGAQAGSRHAETLTYKSKGKDKTRLALPPKTALEQEINNLFDIYQNQGLSNAQINANITKFKNRMISEFKPLFD